ncbi:MAG: response regulator [Bacteroidales bacterium]|nr:response regulator [Bacteroidales bacterium]
MKKLLISLLLIVAAISGAIAQSETPSRDYSSQFLYSYLTVENGLSNNFVDGIYKDSHGFVWISTMGGGLQRYDGYDLLQINTRSNFRVKSNYVRKVCEDNFNRLWIASERGVDVMDLTTYSKSDDIDDSANDFNTPARVIIKDSRGSIWITYDKSITRIDFDTKGNISNTYHLHPGSYSKTPITAIYELDGQMLAGIDNKLMKISNDNRGNLISTPFNTAIKMNCISVKCIATKENEIWIGTDNGLYRYNIATENLTLYTHNENRPRSLSQNMISDIKISDIGRLVVSTLKGLNIYDSHTDDFDIISQYNGSEPERQTINSDFINCIYCDDRMIWVGTESCGITKITKPAIAVKNYISSSNNPSSISHGPVNSIYVDSANVVWAGTVEGGLNRKEPGSNAFKTFTTKDGLAHNSVSYILPIDESTLLLGTWGGGITFFDKNTCRGTKTINVETEQMNTSFVGTLTMDSRNNGVWMGTNHGIYFYSLQYQKVMQVMPDTINSRIHGCLGSSNIHDTLAIGTTMGIVKFVTSQVTIEPDTIIVIPLIDPPVDGITEFRTKVTWFHCAYDTTFYVGTNGYGLVTYKLGKHTGQLNTDNGLPNDIVSSILEDNNHNLWLATSNGLCCYSPTTGRLSKCYKEDGICDNHFFWNAAYKSDKSNILYFGTIKGLVEIDIDRSYNQPPYTKVFLTNLSINDQDIHPGQGEYLSADISTATDLYVHESDKSITIEFSALNYKNPAIMEYQYRLDGYLNEWTSMRHNQRMAVFSNLPNGTYKFQVRCATGNMEFSEPTEITIHVKGYFYKQWWFMLLLILAIIGIALLTGHVRVVSLRQQKQELEDRVTRRTAALNSKTEELSRQNEMLYSQNEEITRQNKEISNQKQQMEKMTQKIQELTLDKLAFFTNITHEFRTPLTLIIGPIERALKLSTNPKVIEQLNFVDHNSKHLLSLVNQLMDFRKVETDNMPINMKPGNVLTLVEDILLPFRALTQEKNIQLNFHHHLATPYIMLDREATHKLVTNLVGNACKYTPDGGRIDVYLATIPKTKKLYFCVSDSGKGIVEADLEKVFNSFYQSENGNALKSGKIQGSGIGLYLCKRIAQLLGGDISARNNHTHGASFRLIAPLVEVEEQQTAPVSNFLSTASAEDDIDDESDYEPEDKHKMPLLIVDDNNEMRQYIRSILSDKYSILEASDGNNALQVLKSHMVDLIISDMMMPGMDGMELAKAVKSDINISHIPMIILTAKTSRDTQLESFRNGVDDYIIKPFDEEVLQAKILALLENRQKFQQRFKTDMDVESLNISEDSSDKKFMDKVMKVIKEKYKDSEFEVSDLVEEMGVSKTLMNKKMQALTQQSTGQFIRSYRLKVAHDLIIKNRITHNMNISEIAYEVGFNDPKYFTRCFTKQFNTTPSSIMGDEGN